MEKARELKKNIYFCFTDCAKAFDCIDHNKLWKILKEMGLPDHLAFLLRNLYAGQEATFLYVYIYTTSSLFIPLLICLCTFRFFHVLPIVNNAAMNFGVHVVF